MAGDQSIFNQSPLKKMEVKKNMAGDTQLFYFMYHLYDTPTLKHHKNNFQTRHTFSVVYEKT